MTDRSEAGAEKDAKLTTRGAIKMGRWLAYCLEIGWAKDALDGLEETWRKYHDEHGNLLVAKES